jgi:formamidase
VEETSLDWLTAAFSTSSRQHLFNKKEKFMGRLLGIGACQMEINYGDVQANLDTLARHVKNIKFYSPWVKLICAPELIIPGMSPMEDTAQPIPGQITEFCANLAKQYEVYLVPGSMYERAEGGIFNTAPVFDSQGKLIATYRKMYPWRPHEKTVSGNRTVTFDIPGVGIVGLCICYDLWFPEVIRDLVWKGAEIILIPTLTGTQDRWQELILCRAAAVVNQCYVVSVNGLKPGGKGHSIIVDPEGRVVQRADQLPENMIAMLDLDHVTQVREYGTCGVSRVMSSYLHESHRFDHQSKARKKMSARKLIPGFSLDKI